MIKEYTLREVQIAWKIFTDLNAPYAGSVLGHYKAREAAWVDYAKVRDHYLFSIKYLTLRQLNEKWYPYYFKGEGFQHTKLDS